MEIEGIVERCITYGGNKRTQFQIIAGKTVFAFNSTVPIINGNYVSGTTLEVLAKDLMNIRELKIYDHRGGKLLHDYNSAYCPDSK